MSSHPGTDFQWVALGTDFLHILVKIKHFMQKKKQKTKTPKRPSLFAVPDVNNLKHILPPGS